MDGFGCFFVCWVGLGWVGLAGWFVRLFVRSFVRSFVCLLSCLLACLLACLLVFFSLSFWGVVGGGLLGRKVRQGFCVFSPSPVTYFPRALVMIVSAIGHIGPRTFAIGHERVGVSYGGKY